MAARIMLTPATMILNRLTPDQHDSRIPATPPPDYAAGLAFHARGHGQPIVLLHGLGSSRAAFNPVFDTLSRHHRVIAVDLPGHGDSEPLDPGTPLTPRAQAHAVGEFLDTLGIERAHMVGNSLGGWVALELAADGRARSVTGLCTAGLWQPLVRRSPLIEANRVLAQATGVLGELLLLIPPVREMLFSAAMERPYRMEFGLARAVAAAQRTATGYDDAHDGIVGTQFERGAAIPAHVPVTLAFGDNDVLLPPNTSQLRHLAPGHATWVVMPRVGHAPMWDDPEATVALIRASVAGIG